MLFDIWCIPRIPHCTNSGDRNPLTRATFETPKYSRRPRDQYTAPNSKYIAAECSAPPPNLGKRPHFHPHPSTYPQKGKKKIKKTLQHGNQPGEVSNNKYICSRKKQDYYLLHVYLHSVCSIFQRMYLFSFSFVALSSLLRTLSSLCRCLSLFFLTFGMAYQYIDLMHICQFINDRLIRNF